MLGARTSRPHSLRREATFWHRFPRAALPLDVRKGSAFLIADSFGPSRRASKVDYELFLEQGRDFQKNYDEKALDRFWADIITAGLSHPSRFGACLKF